MAERVISYARALFPAAMILLLTAGTASATKTIYVWANWGTGTRYSVCGCTKYNVLGHALDSGGNAVDSFYTTGATVSSSSAQIQSATHRRIQIRADSTILCNIDSIGWVGDTQLTCPGNYNWSPNGCGNPTCTWNQGPMGGHVVGAED